LGGFPTNQSKPTSNYRALKGFSLKNYQGTFFGLTGKLDVRTGKVIENRTFAIGASNDCNADKTDLEFFVLADAAFIHPYSKTAAALQLISPMRSFNQPS